ncbi:MAG: shikimate kinase [Ignavibacteria bacterium]
MNDKIIYLNGFMAAGKSTIGPILANTLGWDFYDLDKLIEEQMGKKITQIFEEHGEKFFRRKETEVLTEISKMSNVVIALGGGTSIYNDNLGLIRRTGKVIYLKASAESLYRRLKNDKKRPIFNDTKGGDLKAKILQMLEQRGPYYEKANLVINTDKTSLGITVDKIVKLIYRKKK